MFDEDRPEPDDETENGFLNDGRPTLWTLGEAIQCWLQCRALGSGKSSDSTVREIATAFGNMGMAERIIAAADNHPYLYCQRGGYDHHMDSVIMQDGE